MQTCIYTVLVGFGPLHGQDVMDDQDYDDITAEVHAEASEISGETEGLKFCLDTRRFIFAVRRLGVSDVCVIT